MAKTEKQRLDLLLTERGIAESRHRAQAMIMAGVVLVNDKPATKAGMFVPVDALIRLKGTPNPFVSRGGLKLQHALDHFGIDVTGLVALDLGISTGGFTDCLLQRGAAKVYGIDVGRGQVAWKLRQDERVTLFEETNVRYFDPNLLGSKVDLAVADLSFISLTLVMQTMVSCMADRSEAVVLVKPQFEVGREDIGSKGVVRDPKKRLAAVEKIRNFAVEIGLAVLGETESPVPGPEGNIEFLLHLGKGG